MTMPVRAYPLQWPDGWKRTDPERRKEAAFRRARKQDHSGNWQAARALTINESTLRVRQELGRMGVGDDDIVISTNMTLRLDGGIRADQKEPTDPGVTVYWQDRKGNRRCIAIDHYDRVTGNLAAIAATLDAMRAIERHGGAAILERAFTGFAALTGPVAEPWWTVLGVDQWASGADIKLAYRRARADSHPDCGGTPEGFHRIESAWREACNDRGAELA